ncbi:MAG: hypothetical protein JXB62_08175 [Pirellulales bacterium]|nr:hypothetical protein [Pirellulales bacterium]
MDFGRNITLLAVSTLVVSGTACMGLRFQARRDSRTGLADSAWRLTYSIEGEAEEPGAKLRVAIPSDTRYCRVFRQDFRHSNLSIKLAQEPLTETREIVGVAEAQGESAFVLWFDLRLSSQPGWMPDEQPVPLTTDTRRACLEGTSRIQVGGPSVVDTWRRLDDRQTSRAELAQRVFRHCRESLAAGGLDASSDAEGALCHGAATPLGRIRAMTAFCRAAGIPARLVTGFEFQQRDPVVAQVWLEVWMGSQWVPYDPNHGFARELPPNILAIRHGDSQIALTAGMDDTESEISMVPLPGVPEGTGAGRSRPIAILDLTRLPLELLPVLSVILLMPLGALVTCVFRNVIGVGTSGTFTPTLLALSFVFADWQTGPAMLVAVVVLGVATRGLLDRLKLLMLPRLSIILTLVVCCIVFADWLMDAVAQHPQFVVKPAAGSEGRGIAVVAEHDGHQLISAGGEEYSVADFRYHVSAILAGLYSLGGRPDRAIIEQRILRHAVFDEVAVDGTPDIRVVVYRNLPAMAMLRLPTRASRGRANLHQGAVGVSVDVETGTTFGGVCKSRAVDSHPDTGQPIAGLRIPQWNDLLRAARELSMSLELGYVGIDFVLDTRRRVRRPIGSEGR